MHLMQYRPEIYHASVAGWVGLHGGVQNSLEDAARIIGASRTPERPITDYRVVVYWEEM